MKWRNCVFSTRVANCTMVARPTHLTIHLQKEEIGHFLVIIELFWPLCREESARNIQAICKYQQHGPMLQDNTELTLHSMHI